MDDRSISRAELRTALRQLPPERRRALTKAMRSGRPVEDPRDAALAVAWARRLEGVGGWWWPRWAAPRQRPTGARKWLWIGHAAWMVAVAAFAAASVWPGLSTVWRVVVVVLGLYCATGLPYTVSIVLRMYWNAAESERRNRELLERH